MAYMAMYYKNDGTSTSSSGTWRSFPDVSAFGWARENYTFSGWCASADGAGTIYQPAESIDTSYDRWYAVWESTAIVDYLANENEFKATANAIRVKGSFSADITWESGTGFATAVSALPDATIIEPLSVSANGTYTASSGRAYSPVTVSVPQPSGTISITENGTHNVKDYEYAEVNVSGSVATNKKRNDVTLFDYDGTIIDSYSATEFAALSSLPDNPTHDGLIAQGWNWTLTNAKAYVAKYGSLNIGQMYGTDDGNTRIYISLEEGRLSPFLGLAASSSVTVDWGDGTTSTVTGGGLSTIVNTQHSYASPGNYVITLSTTGQMDILGSNSYGSQLIWKNSTTANENIVYQCAVTKVELGNRVRGLATSAFNNCKRLESITIPNTLATTSFGGRVFYICESLKCLVVPANITAWNNGVIYACRALHDVCVPKSLVNYGASTINTTGVWTFHTQDNVTRLDGSLFYGNGQMRDFIMADTITTLSNDVFNGCYALSSLTIPAGVTSIGTNCFTNCMGMKEYHFKPTTPPTLGGANCFTNIPSDCVIYVPTASLSAYQTAANWSTHASKMQGE